MANHTKKNFDLLPFPIIAAAVEGDTEAIRAVLKHYSGYIATLSARALYSIDGTPVFCLDEDLRQRLEVKLITRILTFKVTA